MQSAQFFLRNYLSIFSTIISASPTPYAIIKQKEAHIMLADKQHKDQLMLQATQDSEFLARCEEIQNDFAAIDASETLNEDLQ